MLTADELVSNAFQFSRKIWRFVESVARVSTLKLVDTLDEQEILEQILERTKPSMPADCAGLHFLLATPFRYRPYEYGSRFRRANQIDGAFYGSEQTSTALAEVCFYRFLFFSEAPGMERPKSPVEHSAFAVECSGLAIDLTTHPLSIHSQLWKNPTDYEACQLLGDTARATPIQMIRYASIRDPGKGSNVALIKPTAFAETKPSEFQTWRIFVRSDRIQAVCEMPPNSLEYTIEQFAHDVRLLNRNVTSA